MLALVIQMILVLEDILQYHLMLLIINIGMWAIIKRVQWGMGIVQEILIRQLFLVFQIQQAIHLLVLIQPQQ